MTISVLMSTYNGEKYIIEQMDSLYNQTRRPDEVIISDDCSIDNTVQTAEKYIRAHGLEGQWRVLILGNYNTCCACSVINGFVVVEDNVFIGANATIRDHLTIKTGTLIGAGTYVNRNCEKDMAVLGAKSIELLDGGTLLQEKL